MSKIPLCSDMSHSFMSNIHCYYSDPRSSNCYYIRSIQTATLIPLFTKCYTYLFVHKLLHLSLCSQTTTYPFVILTINDIGVFNLFQRLLSTLAHLTHAPRTSLSSKSHLVTSFSTDLSTPRGGIHSL